MNNIKYGLLAVLALTILAGCDPVTGGNPGGGTGGGTGGTTTSDWKIKGSFDSWAEHNFALNELDSTKVTYEYTGLYAIDYSFVVTAPDGTIYKLDAAATVPVATDTAISLLASATGDGKKDVKFTASKSSYTVQLDITDAAAPKVTLVSGSSPSLEATIAVLLSQLQLKGDQYSAIDGTAVSDGWNHPAAGTISGNAMSWDLTISSKTGNFGFNSLDGFLKGATVDVSGLTTAGSAATQGELLTTGNNAQLDNPTKNGSVYTVKVTVDSTKTVNNGRYLIDVTLKTVSATNWSFVAPTTIYLNGDINGAGWTDTGVHDALTLSSGVATKTFTASTTNTLGFKFYLVDAASWSGMTGIAGVDTTGSPDTISGSDNIEFAATSGTVYTITFDFSGTYTTTGKPVVHISH